MQHSQTENGPAGTAQDIFRLARRMTMNEGVYKNVHDRDEEECNTARRKINQQGAIAQMGERLLCTQEVGGSIPPGSTIVV